MLEIQVNGKSTFGIEKAENQWHMDGKPMDLDVSLQPNGLISVLKDGKSYTGMLESIDYKSKEVTVRINGEVYKTTIKEPIDVLLSNMGMDMKVKAKADVLKAPMPGLVLRILVEAGQQVKKGDGLLVLEAMKMENTLKANEDCTIKTIKVAEKTAVEKGAVLLEMGA